MAGPIIAAICTYIHLHLFTGEDTLDTLSSSVSLHVPVVGEIDCVTMTRLII
jgi:hypothetical protein